MYDKNGLQLTPMANTFNTYLHTAMLRKARKISAYAPITINNSVKFGMVKIADFADPRDAAFVAQEFNKLYTKEQATQMAVDGNFKLIAQEFLENLEIPEWEFPAEGLTFDDIEQNDMNGYMFNYVNNARDALKEAVKKYDVKVPSLQKVIQLESTVNISVAAGMTYREAAKAALEIVA